MRVLVTGGAGSIGSVVAAQLVGAGHHVTVLDNLSNGHAAAVPQGAVLEVGEIADRTLLGRLLAGTEAVMHLAASIEVGESMRVPIRHFRNNVSATLVLLEAMLDHQVPQIVFSSTAAVYGNPERNPVPESAAIAPTNPYGESKAMVERVLSWLSCQNGLRYASLRYFNAAGGPPSRHPQRRLEAHLIPLVLDVAQGRREVVEIFGDDYPTPDGTPVRDYVHVEDLAAAHLLALQALRTRQRLIYNLGNGSGFSVQDVVEVARRVTGHPIPSLTVGRRAGDPAALVADSRAIREELGWEPRYADLQAIVASAWAYRLSD